VHDELLARSAALVGVVLAREREGLDDAGAVDALGDLVGVLLDDREQVGEQLALDRREVVGDVGREAVRELGAVDRDVASDRDGAVDLQPLGAVRRLRRARAVAAARAVRGGNVRRRDTVRRRGLDGLPPGGSGLRASFVLLRGQAACRIVSLLRNLSPSSRRRW
jgi:hypothetical protein